MSIHDDLDLLDQIQQEADEVGQQLEYLSGGEVKRREFVFFTLAAAAATTFGFGSSALAQGAGRGAPGAAGRAGGQGQQAPPPPLADGVPISWTYQPYPGGTGALFEKLIAERGADAFKRTPFAVAAWSGPVPTAEADLAFLPAHRISALIRARRITSTQITRIYLDRLKRYDPVLLCAVNIMEEQALAEAARADAEIAAGRYRGPLHGVPYGVKDLFAVKGFPTTWGAADFQNRVIDEDAEVVTRLREAGAVLLAKLATGRYASGANWYRGSTRNPWDIRRSASGSSTGPGSATAAGCCAFAIGTETSGSIVSPARENGLSALRPTFGRVSRYGGMVLSWSQDRVGPMCRTIEDCAMVFSIIHGVDPKDPSTVTTPFQFNRDIRLASLRIGVDANAPRELTDKLRELGAELRPIGPRPGGGGTGGFGVESAAFFDSYLQAKARELGLELSAMLARGGGGGRRGGGAADSSAAAAAGAAGAGAAGGAPPADSVAPRGGGAAGRGGGGGLDLPPGTGGRNTLAFEFIQAQRRRHILISQMQELLEDFDMYIPTPAGDIGLHATTGHPTAVVQYKFEAPAQGGGRAGAGAGGAAAAGGGGVGADSVAAGRAAGARGGAARGGAAGGGGGGGGEAAGNQAPAVPQPICAQICGNLYNDDLILSVAHQFQARTDFHTRRPEIRGV